MEGCESAARGSHGGGKMLQGARRTAGAGVQLGDHGGVGLLEMEGWHTARGGGLLVMAGGLLDVVGCWRVAGGLLAMADVR